ncbi:MAG: hypothetical protein CME21_10470 [Gemmatimonadetes bacterium]|nr:hypothetical protein [Gemmatimonadota bacterium]HCK10070.1 hypothetical protein [Candidatus Latescibacterota bacterium]
MIYTDLASPHHRDDIHPCHPRRGDARRMDERDPRMAGNEHASVRTVLKQDWMMGATEGVPVRHE